VQAYLEELPNTGAMSSEWTTPVGGSRFASVSSFQDAEDRDAELGHSREPRLSTYVPETPNRFQRPAASVVNRPSSKPERREQQDNAPRSRRTGTSVRDATRNITEKSRETKISSRKPTPSPPHGKPKFKVERLATVIVLAIAILVGSIWLVVLAVRALMGGSSSESYVAMEKPIASLVQEISKNAATAPVAQPGPLDKETATKIIATWQVTKAKALGKDYEDNLLLEILDEPALSDWQGRAKDLKDSNSYLQYETKSSEVQEVIPDGDNKAKVIVNISESRNYFNNGELDRGASAEDTNYKVEYDLIRKNDKWLIREMLVF
jgi:hypothetical protein